MDSEESLTNTIATVTALLLKLYGPMPPDTVVRRTLPLVTDTVAPDSTLSKLDYIAGTIKLLDDTRPKGEVTLTVMTVPPGHSPLVDVK